MIASANPCQLVCPAHVRCHSPERPAPCARTAAVVSAMCAAEVGLPTWSATTRSSSRSAPRRSIVSRKLRPCAAYTHAVRSEEHTSELQSLMRNSYAVFCLKKNNGDNEHLTVQTISAKDR